MTDREKLIEMLSEADKVCTVPMWLPREERLHSLFSQIADHLLANGVTVQKWIPVTERLPDNKEHDWVLAQVVEDNGFMHIPTVMEYRQQRNDWFEETYGWLSEHNGAFNVTHWMPLPEPPKENDYAAD